MGHLIISQQNRNRHRREIGESGAVTKIVCKHYCEGLMYGIFTREGRSNISLIEDRSAKEEMTMFGHLPTVFEIL